VLDLLELIFSLLFVYWRTKGNFDTLNSVSLFRVSTGPCAK